MQGLGISNLLAATGITKGLVRFCCCHLLKLELSTSLSRLVGSIVLQMRSEMPQYHLEKKKKKGPTP